jgi:hypothetical protein
MSKIFYIYSLLFFLLTRFINDAHMDTRNCFLVKPGHKYKFHFRYIRAKRQHFSCEKQHHVFKNHHAQSGYTLSGYIALVAHPMVTHDIFTQYIVSHSTDGYACTGYASYDYTSHFYVSHDHTSHGCE